MENKKTYHKIFFIGLALVFIQSFFQQNKGFLGIFSAFSNYIDPFIYALFIAILLNPLITLLEEKFKCKRYVSIPISVLIVAGVITGSVFMIIPGLVDSFNELSNTLPQLLENLNKIVTETLAFLQNKNLLILDPESIRGNTIQLIKDNMGNFKNLALSVGANIASLILWLTKFLTGAFIALIILYGREYFVSFIKDILFLVLPKGKSEEAYEILVESKNIFMKYILGRALVSAIVGLVAFVIMFFTGVPYALLNGFLLGIGNMIPYIGTIVAGIVAFFLIVLVSPVKVIYLGIAIIAAQAVDGFLVGPRIGSEAVGMGTFWVIVGVILGGSLWGIPGTILGVPILGIIKLLYLRELAKKKGEK